MGMTDILGHSRTAAANLAAQTGRAGVRVSVVVPSFNHAAFVGRAIESVRVQHEVELELCVVDDGSSDGSPAVIERALDGFPGRCELVVQRNRGAHAAINRGLAMATGDFVHILNSDDCFGPGRLHALVQALDAERAEFAFTDVRVVDDQGVELPPFHPKVVWYRRARRIMLAEPTVGFGLLCVNAAVSTSNFMIRRSLLGRVGEFTPESLCHDWVFLTRILPYAEPFHLAGRWLDYRAHGSNTVDRVMARRRIEGEPALRAYFAAVAGGPPANSLAPSPHTWPGYFELFCATRRPWFTNELMSAFLPEPSAATAGGAPLSAVADLAAYRRSAQALLREFATRDRTRRRSDLGGHDEAREVSAGWAARLQLASLAAPPGSDRRTAVIFGAGKGGERAWAFLRESWRVLRFLDNDPARHGGQLCGLEICAPGACPVDDEAVVFVASMHHVAIETELRRAGMARCRVFHLDAAVLADVASELDEAPFVVLAGAKPGVAAVRRRLVRHCRLHCLESASGQIGRRVAEAALPDDPGREIDFVVVVAPDPDGIVGELAQTGLPAEKIVVVHPLYATMGPGGELQRDRETSRNPQ